jgi:hypothetical protein
MFLDRVFVPAKLFQPSLMFAGKVGVYPSEAPFMCSTLGEAPVANVIKLFTTVNYDFS